MRDQAAPGEGDDGAGVATFHQRNQKVDHRQAGADQQDRGVGRQIVEDILAPRIATVGTGVGGGRTVARRQHGRPRRQDRGAIDLDLDALGLLAQRGDVARDDP